MKNQEQINQQPSSYRQTLEVSEVSAILQVGLTTMYAILKSTKDYKVFTLWGRKRIDRQSFVAWFNGCETSDDKPLQTYTAEQLAERFSFNVRTVYNKLQTDEGYRVLRFGKNIVRVNKASFDYWFDNVA